VKWIQIFVRSAGAILLVAALGRFLIAVGDAQVLSLPEPMLGIPLRYAVLLIGGFELAVARMCLFGKRIGLQLGWLAWLATNYFVIQLGLMWMGAHPQGTAIGSLTDPLHLSRGLTGIIVGILPAYILLGSCAALAWLWFGDRATVAQRREAGFSKMSCPSCGTHIKFSLINLGQDIPCPQCRSAITLRKPENLKMSCFFCKEHIEFPAHGLGQKLQCPHCKRDITLKESTV
jgi:DNA-directed RNA polymerase subunit RPC12/RpoP